MKNTVKQLAAGTFIALLLLAGNVAANGTEVKASSHEIIETSLELENWMTDQNLWSTNSLYTADFALPETEATLDLESWMTSEEVWEVQETIVEEELEVESWMTNPEVWK